MSHNNHGGDNGGNDYDNVPPTRYLGNSNDASHHENDPYDNKDYPRPDSFDVSYYTDGANNTYDAMYMAGDRAHEIPPTPPVPSHYASQAGAGSSSRAAEHNDMGDSAGYSYDAYEHSNGGGNLLSPDAALTGMSLQASHPGKKRRSGKRTSGANSDYDTMSEGAFSIRSSLVRTPASHGSNDVDVFDAYRSNLAEDGRYASYAPSTDSLIQLLEQKKTYRPTGSVTSFSRSASFISNGGNPAFGEFQNPDDLFNDVPYPSWSDPNQIPLSKEEIEDIFKDLTHKLGFQHDNMRNMYDSMMTMLDSRASRMSPTMALIMLHSDYIGGDHGNYRRWFFSAQLDHDTPPVRDQVDPKTQQEMLEEEAPEPKKDTPAAFVEKWRAQMNAMSQYERARQIALWLLLWGEAANLRFVPELLCFLFKLADDYIHSPETQRRVEPAPEGEYLVNVVTPIYNYIRDQGYEIINGKYVKRERDHASTIGYDDVNECFWTPESLRLIVFDDKSKLMDLPPHDRWGRLGDVNWKKSFRKTYRERRTMLHFVTNFNRIWVLHIVVYYYYIIYVADFLYDPKFDLRSPNNPKALNNGKKIPLPNIDAKRYTLVAAGGAIAPLICIFGSICEMFFVPLNKHNQKALWFRILLLFVILAIDVAPTFYIWPNGEDPAFDSSGDAIDGDVSSSANTKFKALRAVAIVQFVYSLIFTMVLAIIPTAQIFRPSTNNRQKRGLINRTFTGNFPPLKSTYRSISVLLWGIIFLCKYIESYFFLALSFKDPFRWLYMYQKPECHDGIFKNYLCSNHQFITLGLMLLLDMFLFFLDTYLWYVVWNTIFSVARSFYLGFSIWTPWRNIFSRLPKRIYAKILATADMEVKYKPKVLCSQVWNAVVISMYREHLLSVEHVQKMLYQQVPGDEEGKRTLKPPTFFVSQDDISFDQEYYPPHSEAERRINFFAQSLSTMLPEPIPVENMPTFTVITPHYGEKILLSLREIIRETDKYTRVTVLEYLKALHPVEWENFVRDTKLLAEETSDSYGQSSAYGQAFSQSPDKSEEKSKVDDLPFYSIGFKSAAPEFALRTRIWASLRSQTLYRTISGFMNYAKAIKLLYRVENPEMVHMFGGNGSERLEIELDRMANRKFKFLVAMQRYLKFNKEEREASDFLLRTYPDLQIAYLEEVPPSIEGEAPRLYSCLIDGHSDVTPEGFRKPYYRVQLPGNPILGDGKSDNQNHAIIFSRGEYLQLIDANQDNYLEECLKIRNVLGEFEEYNPPAVSPYSPAAEPQGPPVAIVGAREYIFSENIGVLGDVAAGKEATFGTLTQRMMAVIGSRLHYGHPDFVNFIYMTTRGGVSKAQKGLHLNEDIYAGMNAYTRGGRIKHTEYFQCGKGRDLGFCSTLNFTTKIGTGMGEQMLSREYYWLGTQLPLDRFLTFYFAHPGFHINNIMIMSSVQMFMISIMYVATMKYSSLNTVCDWIDMNDPTYYENVQDCLFLQPVIDWINRTTVAILLVLLIAFLPLFLQMLTEQGLARALTRLGKQFLSLSPLYEVQVTQVYYNSLVTNLSFGGARYIGTGRGLATARLSFSTLYSRFADTSIYFGMRLMMMLCYFSITYWQYSMIYFWVTIAALCITPFLYNPHQFVMTDFILDYRDWLRWLGAGNHASNPNSWIAHCRLARIRVTGYKRKRLGEKTPSSGHVPRASKGVIVTTEIIVPIIFAIISLVAYMYVNAKEGNSNASDGSALIRAAVIAVGPVAINAAINIAFFFVSLLLGPLCGMCLPSFGKVIAGIVHAIAVIVQIVFFFLLWILEDWDISKTVLGMICSVFIQRALFSILMNFFLTREFGEDEANVAWWTGKWIGKGMGFWAVTLTLREWLCKTIEASLFTADVLVGHLIFFFLSIFTLIPLIDRWHSALLFWLRPSKQIRPPIFSLKQRKQRRRASIIYGILFIVLFAVFLALVIIPQVIKIDASKIIPKDIKNIINGKF
ncbi:1,3-beta-D-glucan synthase [Mycoemilia scoparia]|uniref:1,3-beta-glucan synthase n=1 Tax=Mycoemilia scoparia TaxID=417184 RepID=A0A9W8A0H9_9FUNG|nr:1,3-beta-D-glucan synthase [Mycoemilia scoparia]